MCVGGGVYAVFKLSVIASCGHSGFISEQYLMNNLMELDQILRMH